MDRSDQQLAEIRARLDALGAPTVRGTKVAPRKATKAAPAKRAKPKPKPKAPAPEPEAGPDLVFDYEELPAAAPPPAPLLLNRRRAGARPKGSGPLAGA
jgi:hypothetical protein